MHFNIKPNADSRTVNESKWFESIHISEHI